MDMYKVTLTHNNGKTEVLPKDTDWDFYGLQRMLDKCEIKAFKVELR
jgi:hypothetical protein